MDAKRVNLCYLRRPPWNGLKQSTISSRNKTLLLTIIYSAGPGFIFHRFFIMLAIPIFQSCSYRNTDFLILKYRNTGKLTISRHRQKMKYRNTVFLKIPKYRTKKRTNPVTPEKYKPPINQCNIQEQTFAIFEKVCVIYNNSFNSTNNSLAINQMFC